MNERPDQDQEQGALRAFREVVFHSPNGVALLRVERDEAGRLTDALCLEVNAAFALLTQRSRAVLVGQRGTALWTPAEVGRLLEHAARVLATGEPSTFVHHVEELGHYLEVTVVATGPDEFATIVRDITAQTGTERQLEQLVAALDQAGESIMITDLEGRIGYVNQAFKAITGYGDAEARGRLPWDLLATEPDAGDRDRTPLWHRILGRERWRGRAVKRCRDGRLVRTESTASAVHDADGEVCGYVIIDRDITSQLELEARLQQASKLEAIGQLAGGLAHDFNNMLTVISGHCELLAETVRAEGFLARAPQLGSDLRQIDEAVVRAVTLTRRLMAFSRRETSQPRVVALNGVVSGMLGFLRRLLGEAVEVRLDLANELGNVKVDPAQIEQVIMNLATNARDAMDGRGKLVISTSAVVLDDDYAARYPEVVPGDYVRLMVTDNGCGMDEATRLRIFEPFFTTKAAGEGTGLGMAVVHGIVGQNSGHIHCYSEPRHGTAFSVYFPVVDEAPRDIAEPDAAPRRGGHERILVVEDDRAVRQLTVLSLRTAGYDVDEAASGEEALTVTVEPALLVTDLTLGDTDGLAVAEALTARWPELRTLCMSGYPLATLAERFDTQAIPSFLAKPFSPLQLREAVRDILDG